MANEETVMIGCKLPAGLKIEVGLQTTKMVDRKMHTSVERMPDYAFFILRGWNHHSFSLREQLAKTKSSSGIPHGMNTRPFINQNVPKALWERWKKEHPGSWLLKNEILFEIADGDHASAALRVAEGDKTPKIFEPVDSSKTIVADVKPLDKEEL